MISWTESFLLTALTSSQTASGSNSYFGSSVEGEFGFDANISSSAEFAETTSADNDGATYITKTGENSRSEDVGETDSFGNYSISGSYSIRETHLVNGARTTISQSTYASDYTGQEPAQGGSATNTTITNSSATATRSSQTTTQTTSNGSFTDTITTAVTRSTGTLSSLSVPTTRSTTAQATTTRATQSSRNVTRTTSASSNYISWENAVGFTGVYAGLGRITKILPESNEVVWAIKPAQTIDATGDLSNIADSYTSSFILTAASAITERPTSAYNADSQDPATLFFETGETYEGIVKTSTVSDQPATTRTLYSLVSGGNYFPLVSYTAPALTQTTATQEIVENSFAFVSGSSTTMATTGAETMSAKFGGHTHQVSFLTTSTASRWTDGLALSTYSTTFVGDGNANYGTNESVTEEFEQGASIQGKAMSYGLIAVGGDRTLRDVESSYFDGWAIPALLTSAALQIGLSPDISAFAPDGVLGRAFPRVTAPLALTTVSLGISTRGSSTWSYGPLGVSRTSISTGTTASAQSTSASWTKGGSAITRQGAGQILGFPIPETQFNGLQNIIQRAGGIPAIGSDITAVVAPGKYLTAAGSSSGTVRYGTPQAFSGTKQTAFMAQPDFIAAVINPEAPPNVDQPPPTSSYVRNILPYSSTFFPI
jgi:hypothetical protein